MATRHSWRTACWLRGLAASIALAALALVGACRSSGTSAPIGEAIPEEPLLLAIDAYRGVDQYFLRYRRGDEVFYAAGDLRSNPGTLGARPYLAYEESARPSSRAHGTLDWASFTTGMTPVPILGIDDWAEMRSQLFRDFMPGAPNSGIAVSFERSDYFFFYDSAGRFRARRLIDKPPAYQVVATVDMSEFFDQWQPRVTAFLRQRGLAGEEVLFNTGDLDRGAIPFIYLDLERRLIVLVRYDEVPGAMVEGLPGAHYLQSLWHFVESHSYTVALRPFSSLQSLTALLADTAVEPARGMLGAGPRVDPPPLNDGRHMDLDAWERELDRRLGRPASRGELSFLVDGEAFFTRFIDAVTSAKHSVDIRAYIFDNDDVALEIAEMLRRRSREGIDVRVLFDGLGSIIAGGEEAGSVPEEHRPPLSIEGYLKTDSRVAVRSVKNTWLTGDHVKTMVIDRELAFLGGMNIGREYRHDWHDIMVEINGPVVDEIIDAFNVAWNRAGWFGDFANLVTFDSDDNANQPGYPVRLLFTRPGTQEIFNLQREAIRRAEGYIFVENAYFTDDSLLRELIDARHRGVDVRVIIPLETDRGMITRNIAMAANRMLESGIRVYIYPGFTHAKAAIFDGWLSLGTANLDRLSLRINREMNIATSESEPVNALREQLFERDFAASREMQAPFPERWTDHLIELFGDYAF